MLLRLFCFDHSHNSLAFRFVRRSRKEGAKMLQIFALDKASRTHVPPPMDWRNKFHRRLKFRENSN
jgi:hypothetical protein